MSILMIETELTHSKPTFRRGLDIAILVLTTIIAACASPPPEYQTVYEDLVRVREDLVPPNTPEGKQCLSNCQFQQMQCAQMRSMQESTCKSAAMANAQIGFSQANANYQKEMEYHRAQQRKQDMQKREQEMECRRCESERSRTGSGNCLSICFQNLFSRDREAPRQPDLSDFVQDKHCGEGGTSCDGQYKTCFISCGGEVKTTPYQERVARQVCVKNCR